VTDQERADVLTRAARRLREEQDAALTGGIVADLAPDVGDPTWWRIAADVRRARKRSRTIMVVIALQIALGLGGVGYAAVTGRLAGLVRGPSTPATATAASAHASRATRPRPASEPPAPPPEIPVPPAAAPEIPAPPALPAQLSAQAPAAPAHRAAGGHRLARREATPAPAAAGAAAVDPLYREAHHQHFVRRDFAAALVAWDRFLAVGAGPLVLEARYNRAIALAHLGRRREAIAALRPFAAGEAGAYRQREAQALVERFTSEE
jgi:hypothetical protein